MNFPFLIYPILATLISGEGQFLNRDTVWQYNNKQQQYFLENYFQKKSELKKFNKNELKSWASQDYLSLNKIAKENGFSNEFKQLAKNEVGMLSICEFEQTWIQKESKEYLLCDEKYYEAIKIDSNFEILKSDFHRHLFVKIITGSGDKVYLTFAEKKPNNNDFDFLKNIEYLSKLKKEKYIKKDYDCLLIPKIDFNKEFNINWINGISANGFTVKQYLQKVKLKFDIIHKREIFNEMSKLVNKLNPFESSAGNEFRFDAPFYLWIERNGCSSPIFAAYIDETNWVAYKSFLDIVNEKIDL